MSFWVLLIFIGTIILALCITLIIFSFKSIKSKKVPIYTKALIILLILMFVLSCWISKRLLSRGKINSVAPYAFYDLGDALEIKGGWNFSDTKYESTVIYCDREFKICADYTARLIMKGHLHIASMLWKVKLWGDDIIVAKSAIIGLYDESFLYINRKVKKVYIVKPLDINKPLDFYSFDNFEIIEELQDTFYQTFCSIWSDKCGNYGW